jgi:hypothetical protein
MRFRLGKAVISESAALVSDVGRCRRRLIKGE